MKKYLVEIILAIVFIIVLIIYNNFVNPGDTLTKDEVAEYVSKIDQNLNMPEPMRTEFLNRVRFFGETDNGEAIYLANIFHENDKAEMEAAMWDGLDIQLKEDGGAAHEVYLEVVKKMIIPKGIWPAIMTNPTGTGSGKTNISGFFPGFDDWTEININRYPSRRTILELFSDPEYLEVMPYKLVGLKLITVPTNLRVQFPDLRLALGAISLIILLAVGWIREALRKI